MELCEFHSHIYGKYNNQLFLFEPTWDLFRPIEKVGWNGHQYVPVDSKYKQDMFDDYYGYGSPEMKEVCKKLSNNINLEKANLLTDSVLFWKWCGETEAKWWNDRACVFSSPCVSRDNTEWKKYLYYLNVKAKTLRRAVRSRTTRRLVGRMIK